MKKVVVSLFLIVLAGCADGILAGEEEAVPDVEVEADKVEIPDESSETCVALDACPEGVCGKVGDGCGGTLDCGQPLTECPESVCGAVDDGCGGTLACGSAITTCPEDACGEIDDGCGGVLDCGACRCAGSRVLIPSCGECELGRTVCEGEGVYLGECDTEDLGVSACSAIRYVEGTGTGLGLTSAEPAPSIQKLDLAGVEAVVLMGAESFKEAIRIREGVSLFGRFARLDSGEVVFDESAKAVFQPSAAQAREESQLVGLDAREVVVSTRVVGVEIHMPAAPLSREANVGVRVDESPGVSLEHVVVRGGQAGDGDSGAMGRRGSRGASGSRGQLFSALNSYCYAMQSPDVGAGGVNTMCPDANGGDGGRGAQESASGTRGYGQAGRSARDARGGYGGYPVANAKDGQPGLAGPRGLDGDHGAEGVASWEIVNAQVVSSGSGIKGADGQSGSGGGGGGGSYFQSTLVADFTAPGVSGAGGGAGGCGGGGGLGGSAGAASVGVMLTKSQGAKFEDITIIAGQGGKGGSGGDAGPAGDGGTGGLGVGANAMHCGSSYVYDSGDGGKGGRGGNGGQGGIGAPGPTLGVVCSNGLPEGMDQISVNLDEVVGSGAQVAFDCL